MEILKRLLLKHIPRRLTLLLSALKLVFTGDNLRMRRNMVNNERHLRMLGKQMLRQYSHLSAEPHVRSVNDHEVAVYSQNGEDGVLLYLFSLIGCHDHRFIEFGVGDGAQCNTANLSLNFGWHGLLMEADGELMERARQFYSRNLGPEGKVKIRQARVTPENIDELLVEADMQGEIDLLSIDIDGNDYWVWQAISTIQPRVVVIEYNASLGPRRAIVTEYAEDFDVRSRHYSGFYHGASLAALNKLAREKGYRLVGCESAGVNAFFVREDLLGPKLQPLTPEEAYFPHFFRSRSMPVDQQWSMIATLPFREV